MNDTVDPRIIPLSKSKMLLLVLLAGGFVALGLWMLQLEPEQARAMQVSPTYVHAIGLASVSFFGLCGLVGFAKLFQTEPGLVLNSTGLIDNSSGVSAGLVPWTDIIGFSIYQVHNTRNLVVQVVDTDKYAKRGNFVQRALKKANVRLCGSPVSISSNSLKIEFGELLQLCNDYLARYGRGVG